MKYIELLQRRINRKIPKVCEFVETITLTERTFEDIIDITIKIEEEIYHRSVKNDYKNNHEAIWEVINDIDTDYQFGLLPKQLKFGLN